MACVPSKQFGRERRREIVRVCMREREREKEREGGGRERERDNYTVKHRLCDVLCECKVVYSDE